MSEQANAVLALKNAWKGVLTSVEPLAAAGRDVETLSEETPVANLDLATYHRLAMAHANAAMALRGLVEQLERKYSIAPAETR